MSHNESVNDDKRQTKRKETKTMNKAQMKYNSVCADIDGLTAEIARKKSELAAIVKEEADMRMKFKKNLLVQHIDGSLVGKAETFVEAYEMMKADAEKRYDDAVRTCRAKHVKIVAAKVPTSDYVITESWIWSDPED